MIEQKFKILIVEDQQLVAKDIAARLTNFGYEIVGIEDTFEAAVSAFKNHKPDLVLLDININGQKNGIDIAIEINNTIPTPFIFLTAQTDAETLQKAKSTFPSAYLVKPFTTTHLSISIDLALHNFAFQKKESAEIPDNTDEDYRETFYLKQDFLFIKDGNNYIKINQNDLLLLESEGNYVKIHTKEKRYLIRSTINNAIEKIKQPHFLRVHRSYCINLNKVVKFNENELVIEHLTIPIGRNYKEDFFKTFKLK